VNVLKMPVRLPVDRLIDEPYASIVCYPRAEASEIESRISELKGIDVTEVEFTGDGDAANIPVLGKGYVGVVVVAYVNGERYALKMLRMDGGRDDLFHEAEMLRKANDAGVGPKFAAVTKNFLLSQLIDGCILERWLRDNRNEEAFRRMLEEVIRQCRRLDEAGIDHGELSMAPKHILTDKDGRPFIVDFETASDQRKVSNVTSVCQYLFLGTTPVPALVNEVLGEVDKGGIVSILRRYKTWRSDNDLEALLRVCLRRPR
jgi:putative serine/threonine protein kinase